MARLTPRQWKRRSRRRPDRWRFKYRNWRRRPRRYGNRQRVRYYEDRTIKPRLRPKG